MTEKGREDFSLAGYQYLTPKFQDQVIIRDQVQHSQKKQEIGNKVTGFYTFSATGNVKYRIRCKRPLFSELCQSNQFCHSEG